MSEQRTQIQVLESIERKLDVLVSVALMQGKSQDDQIAFLRDRGMDWATVGSLVGLKADAARMRVSGKGKSRKVKIDG
jgi:hypothetical protein